MVVEWGLGYVPQGWWKTEIPWFWGAIWGFRWNIDWLDWSESPWNALFEANTWIWWTVANWSISVWSLLNLPDWILDMSAMADTRKKFVSLVNEWNKYDQIELLIELCVLLWINSNLEEWDSSKIIDQLQSQRKHIIWLMQSYDRTFNEELWWWRDYNQLSRILDAIKGYFKITTDIDVLKLNTLLVAFKEASSTKSKELVLNEIFALFWHRGIDKLTDSQVTYFMNFHYEKLMTLLEWIDSDQVKRGEVIWHISYLLNSIRSKHWTLKS